MARQHYLDRVLLGDIGCNDLLKNGIVNSQAVASKQSLDRGRRLVTTARPDDFRWRPRHCRHLGKVRVEGRERKAVGLGLLPHDSIANTEQFNKSNAVGVSKQVSQ
jgi:hypothetical protein